MTRQYRIWPLTFTPSPGPARLNADRTPSVISAVIVDYTQDGKDVEVCCLTTEGKADPTTEMALLKEAKRQAFHHLKANPTDAPLDITSEPPSIIERLKAQEWKDYCREMGANS